MTKCPSTLHALAMALCACASTPAWADHSGPSDVGSAPSGLNVVSANTLQTGRWAIEGRATYIKPRSRDDATLEALAASHVHAHDSDFTLNASFGAAYGVSNRISVSAQLPYVQRDELRAGVHAHTGSYSSNRVERLGTVRGVGDASVMAKYKLVDASHLTLAALAGVKLPTGSTHRRTADGERLETEHQPGTGSLNPLVGAAVGLDLRVLQLNASLLYQFSQRGAQATILGDRASIGAALSRRLGPAPHHHDDHGAHDHARWDLFFEALGEWEGQQRVSGTLERDSGGKSIWMAPGARFTAANGMSLAVSAEIPVWQRIRASHPNNAARVTLALGKAF